MSHKCALCGNIVFDTFHAYEAHRLEFHNIREDIRPVNVTGRTHAQIVEDAERTWLEPHLVKLDRPIVLAPSTAHSEDCNCRPCFTARLDKLVRASEESLSNMESGVSHATK